VAKQCGLDKFYCPGSESKAFCPLFKKKCQKNQIVQEVSTETITKLPLEGALGDALRWLRKGK
jgi:hypothetical protein